MIYEKEIQFLKSVEELLNNEVIYENARKVYSKEKVEKLRETYPRIPEVYLDYLREVGEGSFREEFYTIYGDLEEVEDFFDESLLEFLDFEEKVLQFGHDYALNALVFLVDENWEVGEIYHEDLGVVVRTGKAFQEYISEKIFCLK